MCLEFVDWLGLVWVVCRVWSLTTISDWVCHGLQLMLSGFEHNIKEVCTSLLSLTLGTVFHSPGLTSSKQLFIWKSWMPICKEVHVCKREYHFAKRCLCKGWIPLCKLVYGCAWAMGECDFAKRGMCNGWMLLCKDAHVQMVNATLQRGTCAVGEHCFAKRHICKQWMPLCITFYIENC
jgi:hypothetical protein